MVFVQLHDDEKLYLRSVRMAYFHKYITQGYIIHQASQQKNLTTVYHKSSLFMDIAWIEATNWSYVLIRKVGLSSAFYHMSTQLRRVTWAQASSVVTEWL